MSLLSLGLPTAFLCSLHMHKIYIHRESGEGRRRIFLYFYDKSSKTHSLLRQLCTVVLGCVYEVCRVYELHEVYESEASDDW